MAHDGVLAMIALAFSGCAGYLVYQPALTSLSQACQVSISRR
jgi:hypothetical protein